MNNGALHFNALLTTRDFETGIRRLENQIRGISNTTQQETSKIDGYFKNLSAGIGAYFSANMLQGFVQELVNVRGEFQKTEIAFGTMLQSKEKAKELMGQMVDLAAKTPFSLKDVSDGAKQLLAFQVPANEVVETLRRMGDVASALGVPISRINLVYGQVRAKGRLMGDDLRQFTEAGIPMIAELAKQFNKTTAEITDMVSAGKIGFTDVQKVLFNLTNEGGLFYNMMEQQAQSLSGKTERLKDAWEQMLNKIGESNEGILYSGIEGLTTLVENYEELLEILTALTASYGAYKAAVITTATINQWANKTVQSEIATLSISEKMKLGRALVTQRQAEASLREAQAEKVATMEKYKALQVDVQSLAIKKQKAVALATERMQMYQTAQAQLSLAKAELASLGQSATMRQRNIAIKNVEKAQNQVLATQEQAEIARKNALATSTQFYTAKKNLENTATAVGIASKKVENAQEAVSVATKNANAIATARLTIAQRIQTIATNLGARAQAFLNATILANPYALAAAALVALSYGIYKFASQVDTATELQNSLNESINEGKKSVVEKTAKIDALITAIKSENTTNEEKGKLLNQLNTLTNGAINLSVTELNQIGKLDSQRKAYIETLYKQAEAQAYVSHLEKLYNEERENNEQIKNSKSRGKFSSLWHGFLDVWDKDAWSGSFEENSKILQEAGLTIKEIEKMDRATINRLAQQRKAIKQGIEDTKKEVEKRAGDIPKEEEKKISPNTPPEDKKPKKPAKPKDTAIAGSLGAYEEELSKVQETLKNKTLATDKERVKALLQQEKDLQEKIKEIKEQYAQKSFDEELAEIQRQIQVRDKLLQAGYSKESVDEMFPKVKDKTYLGYLEDTQKSLKNLLESGKGNQETAQQLDRINTAIDEFTAKKSYIEGLQQTIENLTTQFSGQELIDKLKKIKNLNANETEQESQEKANLIDKTIEQEEQKMKQAYQRFIQEHKSFEERRLEITKQYDALRKQALEEAGGDVNNPIYQKVILEIDKAESKDQTDLFFEEMQKSKEWVKVFEDMNMVATNKLEEFKRILKQKLTEAKTIEEKIKIGEFIKKIDDTLRSRNPFKALKDGIKALGDESLNALEKAQKLQNGISAAQSVLGDMKGIVSDVRGAFDDLGISTDNALGDFLDDVEQTIEGLTQVGDGVAKFAEGLATKNPVQMVAGAVKAVAGVIKAVSGWFNDDKKRERNIKRWAEALESVKEQYRALEHQMKKTLGEGVYKEQAGIIANLRKQQEHLQRMANEEAGKKKSDGGKIREWQNQIKEINRQISDIMDNMINDIARTDAKTLADQIGDALVDAFARGEDAALAYEKTMDEVMKNAIKSALKQKLLVEPMKDVVDDMVSKMGFGGGDKDLERKLQDSERKLEELRNKAREKGGIEAVGIGFQMHFLKNEIEKLQQAYKDSKKINLNGTFDGLTASEREEIKEKGKEAMNRYMEALKQYEDLFGSADANAESLKGAIKGMSEETAGVLAGQFNAIRINTGELVKNSAFSLEAMKNAVGHLIKIEENTFNLHQMRKDLAELNSKVKGDKDFRANGF